RSKKRKKLVKIRYYRCILLLLEQRLAKK
ncbi:unnamed protein product, partial [Onchocerca ochengi]